MGQAQDYRRETMRMAREYADSSSDSESTLPRIAREAVRLDDDAAVMMSTIGNLLHDLQRVDDKLVSVAALPWWRPLERLRIVREGRAIVRAAIGEEGPSPGWRARVLGAIDRERERGGS